MFFTELDFKHAQSAMHNFLQNPTMLVTVGLIFVSLAAGIMCRFIQHRIAPTEKTRERLASMGTWTGLAIVLTLALAVGKVGVIAVFGVVSLLALWEYARLTDANWQAGLAWLIAFALIPLQYIALLFESQICFFVIIPVGGSILVAVCLIVQGRTKGFIREMGNVMLGLSLTVYLLSYAAAIFVFFDLSETSPVSTNWFLFVILMTQIDDIAQALVGKRIGRYRIAPAVSPKKTWEGFWGGVIVTPIIAVVLNYLVFVLQSIFFATAENHSLGSTLILSLLLGLIIPPVGFFGDLIFSAIKRDMGKKDSGTILPGHGGILDRLDSLTFVAPVSFFVILAMTQS